MEKLSGFQWDAGNRDKCRKHGLVSAEIEAVFHDPALAVFPDPSAAEPRLRAIGRNVAGRYIFVVYTLRRTAHGLFIRPLSARYMHQKEVSHYEQATAARLQDR